MAANAQKVKIDETFRIGNDRLFLPTDPSAPFDETANCRCGVNYERQGNTNSADCPLSKGVHNEVTVLQLLNHFFNCNGRTVRLAFDVLKVPENPIANGKFRNNLEDKLKPFMNRHGEYNVDFRLGADFDFSIFGNVTMRLTGTLKSTKEFWQIDGRLAAFHDTYDFDPKRLGRSLVAEAMTRIFNALDNGRGTAFDVAFVGEKFITVSGRWDSLGVDLTPPLPRPVF